MQFLHKYTSVNDALVSANTATYFWWHLSDDKIEMDDSRDNGKFNELTETERESMVYKVEPHDAE